MTADEARKLVDKADKLLYKETASNGEYSCGFRLYDSKTKTEAIKKKLELDGYKVTYKYEDPCMRAAGIELEESALFRVSWYPEDYVKKG